MEYNTRNPIYSYNDQLESSFTAYLLDKTKSRGRIVLTEEKLDDVGTRLEAILKKSLHVRPSSIGWQKYSSRWYKDAEAYGLTERQSYRAFCLQVANQEFNTVGGCRNRYSMEFLAQNLCFIVKRSGSL
jgi:hypothetical protein